MNELNYIVDEGANIRRYVYNPERGARIRKMRHILNMRRTLKREEN